MATASASVESSPAVDPAKPTLAQFVDRWIYVGMAALFVATVLAAFIPSSIAKVAAMQAGQRPWFPPAAHFHAVMMGSWFVLLLAQSWMVATGRRAYHRKLGLLSLAIVPGMFVASFLFITATHAQLAAAQAAAPTDAARLGLLVSADIADNILLAQMRIGTLFAIFVCWALLVRNRDSGLHKRLMVLGSAILLPPAFARITFLPNTMPDNYVAQDIYTLLWIAPMFLWDLYRQGAVHRAYLIWIAGFIPLSAVVHSLWGTEAWLTAARALMS